MSSRSLEDYLDPDKHGQSDESPDLESPDPEDLDKGPMCVFCEEAPATLKVTVTKQDCVVLDEADLCRDCFEHISFKDVLAIGNE